MVQPPVARQSHVEEGAAEAGDEPGRPGAVAAKVQPYEDHGGGDLRPVRAAALLAVRRGDVLHHRVRGQFVVALDVRANVRPVLAGLLVLEENNGIIAGNGPLEF